MAEVMAVIGTVSATIGTVNTLKIWIRELRDFVKESRQAGETIQALAISLETSQTELNIWMELWGLGEPTSKRYQRELWGSLNLVTIVGRFEAISSSIEKARQCLDSILRSAGLLQKRPPRNAEFGLVSVIDFRNEASETQKKLSVAKIIKFVDAQGPELKKNLEAVQQSISVLRTLSVNSYAAKHKVPFSNALTEAEGAQVKTSLLMQLALETRYTSTAVYQMCRESSDSDKKMVTSAASEAVRLNIDLCEEKWLEGTGTQSMNHIILQYHLLVPWRARALRPMELLVEGPFDPEKSMQKLKAHDFKEAFHAALSEENLVFTMKCHTELRYFRSRPPPEKRKIPSNGSPWTVLRSLIHKLDMPYAQEPALRFPRSQRISLAFKLVQCGMLISGTSWLSNLNDKVLGSISGNAEEENRLFHFLVEPPAFKNSENANPLWEVSQHIFAIGILLLELGLGQLVSEANYQNKRRDIDPYVVIDTSEIGQVTKLETLAGAEWQTRLTMAMGDDYTTAVRNCLSRKTKSCWNVIRDVAKQREVRETAFKEVLKDYYLEVYQPILEVAELAKRERDDEN